MDPRYSVSSRRSLFLVLVLSTTTSFFSLARAGAVPPSAYSESLGMHPALVDQATLTFAFPSRLADLKSGFSVFRVGPDSSDPYSESILGRAQAGANAFGLLSGSVLLPGHPTVDEVQRIGVDWARRFGSLGIGGGIRVAYEGSSTDRPVGPDSKRKEEVKAGFVEPALGFSKRGDRALIELGLAARFPLNESEDITTVGGETTAETVFDQKDPIQPRVSLRGVLPVGESDAFLLFASWESMETEWAREHFSSGESTGRNTSTAYGHEWAVATGWQTHTEAVDNLYLSADYEQSRRPRSISALRTDTWIEEVYGAALSASTGVFAKNLEGLFGLRWSYHEFAQIRADVPTSRELRTELFENRFSWGLQYRWRGLSVTGAMKTDLQLADPFISVDASLFL